MYVGITSQIPVKRWHKDGSGYKKSLLFWRAIQKYGWDNFEHFIFASNITKEEAENMEMLLIRELHTQDGEYGYNILEGGSSPCMPEEVRKKMSEAQLGEKNHMYGRKHTDEELQFLRERFSGEGNPRYHAVVSKETRRKISEAQKGKVLSDEHKRKISAGCKGLLKGRPRPEGGGRPPIKVRCIETGIEYESINEAARQYSIAKSSIRICLKNPNRTARNVHWEIA